MSSEAVIRHNRSFTKTAALCLALLGFLLLSTPLAVSAEQYFGDFAYVTNAAGVIITRYIADGYTVGIPSTINGLPVTSIGNYAFMSRFNLRSVSIPDSVTSIGGAVFQECPKLSSVTIPNSVTNMGWGMFAYCTGLSSITIGTNVTSIGDITFLGCYSLSTITIPNSVTSIGDRAFQGCSRLNDVTVGNSVTNIGLNAFEDCTSLTGVYFQGNAPSIGDGVFANDDNATIYYREGTTGWGATYGGRPTVMEYSGSGGITSPANGSTLSSSCATFSWDAIAGATRYALWVGTSPGGYDLYPVFVDGLTRTFTGLPTNGSNIYVRLWAQISGTWHVADNHAYTAALDTGNTTRVATNDHWLIEAPNVVFNSSRTTIITDGGTWTIIGNCTFGNYPSLSNNAAWVVGPGSVWSNSGFLDLNTGGNALTIANSGQVYDTTGIIRTLSSVTVTDPGSIWNNSGDLYVGTNSCDARLVIANGAQVLAANAFIGSGSGISNNSVLVTGTGSSLILSNSLTAGYGTITLNSGTVVVNQLYLTNNTSSVMNFNGGVLQTGGSTVSNGVAFAVGDGVHSATLDLFGGAHGFADGLFINTSASLIGTGSITGSITNAGVIAPGDSIGVITDTGDLSLLGGAMMSMELGGTNTWLYDQFDVSGALNFGGTLSVSLVNGFTPQAGDRFDLFDFGSGAGAFGSLNLPALDPSLYWNTNLLYSTGVIEVDLATARVLSPAPGSTNNSASVTFTWDTGVGASQYALWVGSASNSYDLHALLVGTNLSRTLSLPVDGRALYVRLWSCLYGNWEYNDYSYRAFNAVKARFTGLGNGATFGSANVTLTWDAGAGASQYALWVGSSAGGHDLYAAVEGANLSRALTGLPTDGRRLYVRLWSLINGTWKQNDYMFTAYTAPTTRAEMISPTNGTVLVSNPVTLN
ncbi:MAG: leucine-rich repeat protein, partial [Verrucomicrobia bacterium]|nr:leucine-rich repeat protein [Verrucomicrobiota bacterium]